MKICGPTETEGERGGAGGGRESRENRAAADGSITVRVRLSGPDALQLPPLQLQHCEMCQRSWWWWWRGGGQWRAKQKLSARLDPHVNYRLMQHSG